MHAALWLQDLVVALAVLLSAGYLVRRQFPQSVRRWRIALAVPLLRETRHAGVQRLGRWLAPAPRAVGGGCGGCGGCDSGCTPGP
jgi:hypothetical protein